MRPSTLCSLTSLALLYQWLRIRLMKLFLAEALERVAYQESLGRSCESVLQYNRQVLLKRQQQQQLTEMNRSTEKIGDKTLNK